MKKTMMTCIFSIAFSSAAFATISSTSSCPDLAGTYQTADGATFSITSKELVDGTAVFDYVNDVWVADGKIRDPHTGTLTPTNCPSQIVCQNKTLIRSYTCYGVNSTEMYSLVGGNIKVVGAGMGLNGTFIYTRIGN